MTDKELDDKRLEVVAINTEIQKLKSRKSLIVKEIQAENKERVFAKYPDIKEGDKVKIIYEPFFYWNRSHERKELIGFFGGAYLDSWDSDTTAIDAYKFRIYKVKKDGTQSLRNDRLNQDEIISITKID